MIYKGDCLIENDKIESGSVDLILTDLPFGTTACKWDKIIPIDQLWKIVNRILKPNCTFITFSQQPFTSLLISSNISFFKYMLYWRKSRPSGFVNAKLKPLKDIEEICIFSNGTTANGSNKNMTYNPQGLIKVDKVWKRPKRYGDGKGVNFKRDSHKLEKIVEYENYPRQILDYSMHNNELYHPTQKPIDLLEYLIETFSNENNLIVDLTMGSGSTGVACVNTNRRFIGIEKDDKYFKIAEKRINAQINKTKFFNYD